MSKDPRPAPTSLARASLKSMAVRISVLVTLTSGFAFVHLHHTLDGKTRRQLDDYIDQRGARETQRFSLAESNVARMRDELERRLRDPTVDGRAVFASRWEKRPDGTYRQAGKVDVDRQPTMYFGAHVAMTPDIEHRLGVIVPFVEQFGAAYRQQFADTYVTIPENGMALLWPGTDWGNEAPADLDMRKEEYIAVASPAQNPGREVAWTGMYYDVAGKVWMVSVEAPLDLDGRWVATAGHDLLLDELLERAVKDQYPGATNVVFREDGNLIAHRDHGAAIQAAGGKLDIRTLGPELSGVYAAAMKAVPASGGAVVEAGDDLLAVHRIPGPDWVFVVQYPKALIQSEAMTASQVVFGLGIFSLLMEILVLFFTLRSQITKPLAVLTESTRKVAAGDLSVRVKLERTDELGQLAQDFNAMTQAVSERDARLAAHAASLETTVAERTAELAVRNAAMRTVLDHVRDGLVTIDLHGRPSRELSAAATRYFGELAADDTLATWIGRHAPGFGPALEQGLELLRDDVLPRELALEQLPRAVEAGESRSYQLGYVPICRGEVLEQLLVVIVDVTAAREAERQHAEQKEAMAIFERIMRDKKGFLDFHGEATVMVERLTQGALLPIEVVLRNLHTLKGNAAIFGITSMVEATHALESRIADDGQPLSTDEAEELAVKWAALGARMKAWLGTSVSDVIEVDDAEYRSVLEALFSGKSSGEIARRVQAWRLEPTENRLGRLAEQARRVASRLGKGDIEVEVRGQGVRLDADTWRDFWAASVHVIRNAVDHGLDTPEERRAAGKSAAGRLELSTRLAGGEVVVEFRDDGRGIDWARVAERAQRMGMPAQTHAERVRALFVDGLTTRDEVTELSGRGVGLAAVEAACADLGGRVEVDSERGRGTTFRFCFPLAGVRRPQRYTQPPVFAYAAN